MRFQSDQEVWSAVEKFESCEYGLAEFTHARHLAVGVAYLSTGSFAEAMERMRVSLQRFSAHHGKMGYHETITRFWLMRLAKIAGAQLWERANRAVEELANKDLIFDYYERAELLGEEAREKWVPPRRI